MVSNKRLGTYVTKKVAQESYQAYLPPSLSPANPPLNLAALYQYIDNATQSISRLNAITESIPNKSLFMYMYVRKEALLSSQIEGTQSSLSDLILFEHHQKPNVSIDDVEEVSNYVAALHYGLKRLKDNFPLSLRLLREIHAILLQGGRGSQKSPGEFRTSQNWIGGTRPGNALFVPPPPEALMQCLGDFENFLHDETGTLPTLVKIGLVHLQFESIHPFLDGNGRLGRLLITVLLCMHGILSEPILYLSLYLKQNRDLYYKLLQEVRTDGNWEAWLEFFLKGLDQTARKIISTTKEMNNLFLKDLEKINTFGRAKFSCIAAHDHLKKLPQTSAILLAEELGISVPTARASLNRLVDAKILEEITGKKQSKIYVYKKYLDILENGTEPL